MQATSLSELLPEEPAVLPESVLAGTLSSLAGAAVSLIRCRHLAGILPAAPDAAPASASAPGLSADTKLISSTCAAQAVSTHGRASHAQLWPQHPRTCLVPKAYAASVHTCRQGRAEKSACRHLPQMLWGTGPGGLTSGASSVMTSLCSMEKRRTPVAGRLDLSLGCCGPRTL